MSLKHLTITLAIVAFVAANQLCSCPGDATQKEVEELRKFLLNIQTKDEDAHKFPVLPGELSPLVPCGNCIEKDRKKRTILERPKQMFKLTPVVHKDESRNKCPLGYRRIAFMCVPV